MDHVRFGVIGLGSMGHTHTERLFAGEVPGAVLTAVCDVKQDRLDWAKNLCGDSVSYFLDSHELITSGLVDAVMIATPHYFHPIIGIDAFEHGLNVLSEKPIGVYTKKVHEFYDAAKKSGKAFGIMYNQRTDPHFRKMREIVQSGALGQLKRGVWIITNWYRTQSYYNSGGWRATWSGEGGGVLMNQCPHNLDLWQWIFGMPCSVYANCEFGKYHDIEVEDDVTAMAKYPNGATGMFITTTGEYPGTNRFEISGSKGRLIYDDGDLHYLKLAMDERDFTAGDRRGFAQIPIESDELLPIDGAGEQHVGILKNFTNHLLYGEELIAPGYDGINGLSIANAMMLSSYKKDWVDLPNDGEEYWALLQSRIAVSRRKEDAGVVLDTAGTYGTGKK